MRKSAGKNLQREFRETPSKIQGGLLEYSHPMEPLAKRGIVVDF